MDDKIREVNDSQMGIDNDPKNDAEKGAKLGGIGGAVVGGIAGSTLGPAGAVVGAVVGGVAGAAASGAAVGAIDKIDDDTTVSGISSDKFSNEGDRGHNPPGIQTGGHAVDGTPDTRGITEKVVDAITGDKIDDKTGKRIDN